MPRFLAAVLIAAAGVLTYANTLSNPFLFDDEFAIVRNETIRDLGNLRAVLSPPVESPPAGRPLVNLSFALNYRAGGLDVRGYHLVNLALHVGCGLLLFGIIGRTIRSATSIAFAVALLWTVHPLNSEVVAYVTERTESMMALCYLLGLYASIRAAGLARPAVWTMVAVVASAAGMACKESMVTLPVTVALYDRVFLFQSWRDAFRRRWPFYAGLAATWIVLAVLLAGRPRTWSSGFATAAVSPWTYLLNQAVLIPHYLRLAVWPDALVLNYGWARPLAASDVWPQAIALLLLLALTVQSFRRYPKIGFLWAWVFITLAPTSSIVPIGGEVGAERRMYLSSAAIVAFAVMLVVLMARRFAPVLTVRRMWGAAALVLVAVPLVVTTRARNAEYGSALRMAETVLARWPTPVAHHMVGTELSRAGRHQEALAHLREAAKGYPPGRFALGLEAVQAGVAREAIDNLQQFVREEPGSPSVAGARLALAQAFERERLWSAAADQYRAVLQANPADVFAYRRLADALFEDRRFDEAVPPYKRFLDHGTGDAATWDRYARSLAGAGRPADAIPAFRRAVNADPRNAAYRVDLAGALAGSGDTAGARHQAEEALRLEPSNRKAEELLRRLR
jgi:protein O-mannosyl-transferase